jgi:hypothetical protein
MLPVTFLSSEGLIGFVTGTVATRAGDVGFEGAVFVVLFASATGALGAAGSSLLALFVTFTFTPCPAADQGACAGALLVILSNFPGAAANPLTESNSVSVCATIGIGDTDSGAVPDPVFKLTLEPFKYKAPPPA